MQVDARTNSLLSRIRRRHATVTEDVRIGARTISFTRIADPNGVLDEVAASEDLRDRWEGKRRENPLHLPYWAELWDSALGVAQFVERRLGESSGFGVQASARKIEQKNGIINRDGSYLNSSSPSALDLGCGMGLCGSVAAAIGWNVLFADLEAEALLFARLNSMPSASRVRTRQLNWQTDQLEDRFDLIIGADILYERNQWEHLYRFWEAHLKPTGTILLGEPGRQTGTFFAQWVDRTKWRFEQFAETVSTRSQPIRIFQLSLQGGGEVSKS